MKLAFASAHPFQTACWFARPSEFRYEISAAEIAAFVGTDPTVLEAGAADGRDTERLALQFPLGTVVAVEPVPAAFEFCMQRIQYFPNVIPIMAALGDEDALVSMNVAQSHLDSSPDSSSLLKPSLHLDLFPEVTFVETIEVRCFTLDSLIREYHLPSPTVLRLDLQGMELRVLMSSPTVLATVRAIVTEGSRRPLYAGAAKFSELRRFLHAEGFELEIDRVGAISGNALFLRRDNY